MWHYPWYRKLRDQTTETIDTMKDLNKTVTVLSSNTFKNSIIAFGFCLSIFTITSFDNLSAQTENTFAEHINAEQMVESNLGESNSSGAITNTQQSEDQQLRTHRNFIASYFLQESSVKRDKKREDKQGDVIGHLLQLPKVVFKNAISVF